MTQRKLKILCLHGYQGNERALRHQMRGLIPTLEAYADLVFLEAPSVASGDFGWWRAKEKADSPDKDYQGFEQTKIKILETFAAEGPIDGVFGFSQGAALAGILVGLRTLSSLPESPHPLTFSFAMMIGGFLPADPKLRLVFGNSSHYRLPSLHMFGRSDAVVSPEASEALAARFEHPTRVVHADGHIIAHTPEVNAQIKDFLEAMVRLKSAV